MHNDAYIKAILMRTTLDIPKELMEEAQEILGFKSKTDVVILSLKELIRKRRIEDLKDMAGKIDLHIDVDRARNRRKSK